MSLPAVTSNSSYGDGILKAQRVKQHKEPKGRGVQTTTLAAVARQREQARLRELQQEQRRETVLEADRRKATERGSGAMTSRSTATRHAAKAASYLTLSPRTAPTAATLEEISAVRRKRLGGTKAIEAAVEHRYLGNKEAARRELDKAKDYDRDPGFGPLQQVSPLRALSRSLGYIGPGGQHSLGHKPCLIERRAPPLPSGGFLPTGGEPNHNRRSRPLTPGWKTRTIPSENPPYVLNTVKEPRWSWGH